MNKRFFLVLLLIFLSILTKTLNASTYNEQELICPLDGTKFKTWVLGSISRFGQNLDLQPTGSGKWPLPIPVCPICHFVIYQENFTEEEKKSLRAYINSLEYQQLSKDKPPYFLLAKILEHLKKDTLVIAYMYLQASWEVENIPEQYRECAEASLSYYKTFLEKKQEKNEEWQTAQLVAGELERRLGYFSESQKRFSELSQLPEFQQGLFAEIINYQLELIQQFDSEIHAIPSKGK